MTKPLAQLPAPPWPGGKAPPPSAFSLLGQQDQLFVELYRQSGDAMASAVRAKMFSPEYPTDVFAAKTLERAEIQAAIAALDQAQRERIDTAAVPPLVKVPVEITKDVIMADLQSVFEVAMGNDFVPPSGVTPAEAAAALVRPRNLGAAIAAKKVQASMIGALKQTVDVNFHMKRAEDMTDDELDRIIKQAGKKSVEGDFKDVTPGDG